MRNKASEAAAAAVDAMMSDDLPPASKDAPIPMGVKVGQNASIPFEDATSAGAGADIPAAVRGEVSSSCSKSETALLPNQNKQTSQGDEVLSDAATGMSANGAGSVGVDR